MTLKSLLQSVLSLVLVLSCFTYIHQHQQEAAALFLQDSLFEFNWYDKYNYYEDQLYNNTVTYTNFDSEILLQTGINRINFNNVTNLTDNAQDSVYGQIDAASENDMYLVWQDSVRGDNNRNYDIFFKRSSDGGNTFGNEINLSNNNGFSEHPQLASSGNNVYVIWADNTFSANREIFFVRSTDGGNTFDNPINLSDNIGDSYNQEIFAFGDDVYIVWQDNKLSSISESSNSSDISNGILLKSSTDGGTTFSKTLRLSNNSNDNSFPKVAAYNEQVYVVWNVERGGGEQGQSKERGNTIDTGLFFVKSPDRGSSFGESIKLNHPDQEFGEAQIAASGQDVYIVWGGSHLNTLNNLFFTKSTNSGNSFSAPNAITNDDSKFNPSNVEIAVDKEANNNKLYIAWQSIIPSSTAAGGENNKEEILFKMSSDNGNTFDNTINLSKNHDISECPSLTVYNGKIYIAWEDLSPGNHEILFTRAI
jgi:hypothetical protein